MEQFPERHTTHTPYNQQCETGTPVQSSRSLGFNVLGLCTTSDDSTCSTRSVENIRLNFEPSYHLICVPSHFNSRYAHLLFVHHWWLPIIIFHKHLLNLINHWLPNLRLMTGWLTYSWLTYWRWRLCSHGQWEESR